MRVIRWFNSLALLMLAIAANRVMAEEKITLKKGDRIVFLGDSITQGGGGPKGYVTLIANKLKEKKADLGVQVVNAGISGNKVPDLVRRLQRDVIEKKPTIVFVYIGINDVWHGQTNPANGTSPERFQAGLKEVAGKLTASGAQVVLCTPSVIGEKKGGANPLDAKLDEYSGITRKIASELKLPLCDLRKAFVEHLKDNNPEDKEAGILTGDGVHLIDAGNQLVADEMSKSLGL